MAVFYARLGIQWTVDSGQFFALGGDSCFPRSPSARDLHPTDEDLSVGTPAWGTHFLWTGESGLRARLGSCSPTLAGKTRTRLGWGTHVLWVGSGRSSKIVRRMGVLRGCLRAGQFEGGEAHVLAADFGAEL